MRLQFKAVIARLRHRRSLYRLLMATDFAGLEQLFTAFFASMPAAPSLVLGMIGAWVVDDK